MSDITKKIYSIEPEVTPSASESSPSDQIRPVLADKHELRGQSSQEDVPKFVTREAIQPRTTPPPVLSVYEDETRSSAGWVILGFGVIYLIGAGLYFGLPLFKNSPELLPVAGLVLLLTLPLILLFLLWRSFRHLGQVSKDNARYAEAAKQLLTPDQEALDRTENLASGIRSEISKVNGSLADTVETLRDIQISITRETQALDVAGLQLFSRSEDVGRNLTLQRQALESISGTFDTRMETLSSQISDSSNTLDSVCETAETKLTKASEALQLASGMMDQTIAESSGQIDERISNIEAVSRKLDETLAALTADLNASTDQLTSTEGSLLEKTQVLENLNAATQSQISNLQATIGAGNDMLGELQHAATERATSVQSYYDELSAQLKHSEDETLASQGETARMVETNLAQMRRDFSRMETELKTLQSQLRNLRTAAPPAIEAVMRESEIKPSRLNLMPLESDFPPVEPPRHTAAPAPSFAPDLTETPIESPLNDAPLNLVMDMEIESEDSSIADFEPDVIRRPGVASATTKAKGFGRRSEKDDRTGWRWRDMLGSLERPDATPSSTPAASLAETPLTPPAPLNSPLAAPPESVDGAALLTRIQLSPSAIVDEGTVIEATQARIKSGEIGLISAVSNKLPEAVVHLRERMAHNQGLASDLQSFSTAFGNMIGNTPPTAPALRAALGSPDGRAYLLAVAALKG